MDQVTDALLRLARLSRVELRCESVKLQPMAHEILELLRAGEPDRNVQLDCPADIECSADPSLLQQVMQNLISNAWKFTRGQTAAVVALGQQPGEGGEPVYFVRDNGLGFDMNQADRLFGLFERLHPDVEGCGIGLATVRKIVARHGGRIWAHAEPGRGATFYFTIANCDT
jgi:signal transduction histidine kinase